MSRKSPASGVGFDAFPGQSQPASTLPPGNQQSPGNHAPAPIDESLDLAKYITGLRRRWALLVVCCLVAATFAVIRYTLTEKEYSATATIQIERKRLSLLALGQAGWLEDWWNLEYYPTQYRLLRSRGMAERVVMNLRLYGNQIFNPRVGSVLPSDGEAPLDSSAELASLASRLRGGLSVNPVKETQLVELTYISTSPELAAQIANGYAEAFIEWGIESRSTTVGQASDFLTAQIESLRVEIEEKQTELNSFATDGDFSLDPAGEALLERRQTLEKQYNTVVAERIDKEAAYRQLASLPRDSLATSSNALASEIRGELLTLEGEYESKLAIYTPEWPEMVALKAQIDEKREQLGRLSSESRKGLVDQASADYQKALREEQSLERELQRLADSSRSQNQDALRYANLRTYIDTRKELLLELVKRQSETEVASRVQGSQGESNVRIVDRAIVPGGAFRPSLQGDLTKALVLGLLFGVGAVVLLEFFDRSVKTPEELETLLSVPVLAVVPDISESQRGYKLGGRKSYQYGYGYGYGYSRRRPDSDGKQEGELSIELLPHHSPRLAVSEAYRSLRTALLLSTADELRVLALTSAEPGEGKTATSTNLGVVMAQLGRRVLLIDGDLRRPRLHKVFKTSNRVGVVNYLTGHTELEKMVTPTPVENLYMVPSGPIPPNPSELLASERMQEFLQAVRDRFDLVIIDTPPVLPVADAIILGTQADGVVVCARAGVLDRDDARFCRERLQYPNLRLLGAVLNRHRTSPGNASRKYRYYGVYEETATAAKTDAA